MGARVSIVMSVENELALTRACVESLTRTTEPFELVVVDNGSTDETPQFFERLAYPHPVHYERPAQKESVIAALNRAWRAAETDYVCVLHNDTEVAEPRWLERLLSALAEPGVGLAGLCGAKRVRADGRLVGRTIVHSLAEGPTVRPPWEDVAVLDGVCMCLSRDLMDAIGGFDESYGGGHGHDRDLSFAVRETGHRCVVVHAPFHHRGGRTRTREFADLARERADRAGRRDAAARFVAKYRDRLPCDVRPTGERVRDFIAARLRRFRRVAPEHTR